MRPSHIETILDREFDSAADGHHTPVMLWGPPGVGKSQIVAKIAQQHGVPLIDVACRRWSRPTCAAFRSARPAGRVVDSCSAA